MDDKLCQEVIDYLNQPFDVLGMMVESAVEKAKMAKNGEVKCDQSCVAHRSSVEGHGWVDHWCAHTGRDESICPIKKVPPYRYKPHMMILDEYEENPGIRLFYKDKDITDVWLERDRAVKEAVDEVYKDWDD